jgi:hypothetical protein
LGCPKVWAFTPRNEGGVNSTRRRVESSRSLGEKPALRCGELT